jgi:CheY-like chemotaxis protein
MGLGYAAARDLVDFLKNRDKDDAGVVNPVAHGKDTKAIVMGSSQSGRMMRSFLHLGFNRTESGKIAYDGMLPHIGGGLMPLSVRFAQPGRAWGETIDHAYPAADFPFTYARQTDPLTGRTQGLLDRCAADNTCPRIFHAATALEVWEGRQSLGLTDPLGTKDVADPANVRTYIMGSTQHSPAALPLPAATVAPRADSAPLTPEAQLDLRVLVVEDNAVNQKIISSQLTRLGCTFQLAGDGEAALATLDREPLPDVILMDCHMPKLDGWETTRRIRAGAADIMIAGGGEEFCPTMTMVFDRLYATSNANDAPATAVKPFDKKRDGLVIGEGAAMLVLEELEHALARGAKPKRSRS